MDQMSAEEVQWYSASNPTLPI